MKYQMKFKGIKNTNLNVKNLNTKVWEKYLKIAELECGRIASDYISCMPTIFHESKMLHVFVIHMLIM